MDGGPRDVAKMLPHEVAEELARRNIPRSGIVNDDVETLRRVFEREYEEQRKEEDAMRVVALAERRKKEEEEKALRAAARKKAEELASIEADERLRFWIGLTRENLTPSDVVLRVSSPVGIRAFAKFLVPNRSIVCLDVGEQDLRDDTGVALAEAIAHNTSLLKLEAVGNKFGPETARAFGAALRANRTLRCLDLSGNPLTSGGADGSGVLGLVRSLEVNDSLTHLGLAGCVMGEEASDALAAAMDTNRTLLGFSVGIVDCASVHSMAVVQERILANLAAVEEARVRGKRERAAARRAAELERRRDQEAKDLLAREEWVAEQSRLRHEARAEAERERLRKEEEEKQARERTYIAWREELKAAEAAKAAKKKKK